MLSAGESEPKRHPTGKEIQKLLRILGAATVATGPVILDTVSAHVEQVPQNDARDNFLSKISIPDLPQISTPVPTPVPNSIGGRGFGITSRVSGIETSWKDGSLEKGYNLLRFGPTSGVTVFPQSGMLPEFSASFIAQESPSDAFACFVLIPIGQNGETLSNSDVLCKIGKFQSALGAPRNFTIRLNESSMASFSFNAPEQGEQDGYLLVKLGGTEPPVTLPSTATSASYDTKGLASCFVLFAIRNGTITDVLCGIPGLANFPNLNSTPTPSITLTKTPSPRETPTPTRTSTATEIKTSTPTATGTATKTPIPGPTQPAYYTQFQSIESPEGRILIKAGSSVNPEALIRATNKALDRLNYRSNIRTNMLSSMVEVIIVGQGIEINTLPEPGPSIPPGTRGYAFGRFAVVAEENLLELPSDQYTQNGINIFDHEFAGHVIQWYGITDTERGTWRNNHFPRLASQTGFPENWRNLANFFTPIYTLESEAFADISRLWFKGLSSQIRAIDEGTYNYFLSIHGPR